MKNSKLGESFGRKGNSASVTEGDYHADGAQRSTPDPMSSINLRKTV